MANQSWDPSLYDQRHAYVYTYGEDVLGLLLPRAGERVLDVGCGNGHLTARISESGARVIGIDQSPEMIESARTSFPAVDFRLADAANFSFPVQFDAIFSNAALHWVLDAENAVICMSRALKPGGRFVAEFGGKGNVARVTAAVEKICRELGEPGSDRAWYFPSIGEYVVLLERHGFLVRSAWLFDRPTKMDGGEEGLRGWLKMFGGPLLNHLPTAMKERVVDRVEEVLKRELFKDGSWFIDYRRLRIIAERAEG